MHSHPFGVIRFWWVENPVDESPRAVSTARIRFVFSGVCVANRALFVVDGPKLETQSLLLAATLRVNGPKGTRLFAMVPKGKADDILPLTRQMFEACEVELLQFDQPEGQWSKPYPHGNKLLATLEKRDTEFSAFFDSDVLCLRPNKVENIVLDGHVSLTPAASMVWGTGKTWNLIYETCNMEMPEERIKLMRQKGARGRIPYFSSGLFSYPEQHRNADGKSFPEVWMDIAQTIDRNPDIPGRRPYLDQISLPLAIQKAGLKWNLLPEEQHFILGGSLRGEPLPEGREIFTVHYRKWEILKEVGLAKQGKRMLEQTAGVRRIDQISKASTDAA